jgi:hypothetical protein
MNEPTQDTTAAANPGVVAVTDQMEAAGAIVYIRTSGGIPLEALSQEWHSRGLTPELLPSGRTEDSALRRALADVKRGGRELIRPLAGHAGLALVDEEAKEDDLDYAIILRARVAYTPQVNDTDPSAHVVVDPADHDRADDLRDSFNEHLTKLSNAKISQWIWGTLGASVQTVSLRETGGVYFVPRTHLDSWNEMAGAISTVADVKFYGIPAMESEDAVEAILDAITAEAEAAVTRMDEDLSKTGDEALGSRALKTREAQTQVLREKVEAYEKLLNRKLPELTGNLDGLESNIGGALLVSMADD